MVEKWMKLIEQFQQNGYKPSDIQRIVMLYEMNKENDQKLKEMLEQENEIFPK